MNEINVLPKRSPHRLVGYGTDKFRNVNFFPLKVGEKLLQRKMTNRKRNQKRVHRPNNQGKVNNKADISNSDRHGSCGGVVDGYDD